MYVSAPRIEAAEAEAALQRVLGSAVFEKAHRSQRFLRYLFEAWLVQPGNGVKEYTIALEVFDRPSHYDPSVDATVRVEASRLRQRLREYYDEEGRTDVLLISIPKGSYQAVIERRSSYPRQAFTSSQRSTATTGEVAGDAAVPVAPDAASLTVDNARRVARPIWAGSMPSSWDLRAVGALATAVAVAVLLLHAGMLRAPLKAAVQESKLFTFGWSPALSRDGKLLAYASALGGGTPEIWLQQTAGHHAIATTAGSEMTSRPNLWPDFSPDGTHIVFFAQKGGGGIFIAPTLPGEARLLVASPQAEFPRFSPAGDRILYWQEPKAFTVSTEGGNPVSVPVKEDFTIDGPPMWSPDGSEVLFHGAPAGGRNKQGQWWLVPSSASGIPEPAQLPGVDLNALRAFDLRAWIETSDHRESIVYVTGHAQDWKLWQAWISRRGDEQKPTMIASGSGVLGESTVASDDGKFAYNVRALEASIYQIPIGARGEKLGPASLLPLSDRAIPLSPSLSRDGKQMAYDAHERGQANSILLRDLYRGTERLVDDTGRTEGRYYAASISPAGSEVAFERDCAGVLHGGPASLERCSFIVGGGKKAEQVCAECTPRGFSPDGSLLLVQKNGVSASDPDYVAALDLRTGKEREYLRRPGVAFVDPVFSWDGQWVIFGKRVPTSYETAVVMAPVRNGSPAGDKEWVAITDGKHGDNKAQISPDGNTIYFTSARDGYLCVWAQRLNHLTKRPEGAPFAVEHFHNYAGRTGVYSPGLSDLTVGRDKLLVSLPTVNGEIWMTRLW